MHPTIQKFTEQYVAKFLPLPGKVLEIGSFNVNGEVRQYFSKSEEYTGIDQSSGPGVDAVVKSTELLSTFGENRFDTIVCCEMLEHDPSPWVTVGAIRKMLKPMGHLIVSSPANGFPEHKYPCDFWRFMPDAFREFIFAGFKILHLECGEFTLCGGMNLK